MGTADVTMNSGVVVDVDSSPLISKNPPAHEDDSGSTIITLTDFQKAPGDAALPRSWRRPVRCTIDCLRQLSASFSWRFLSWLAIQNFTLRGGVISLLCSISLPLFKDLKIDAARQQIYATMAMSPAGLRPFIGVVSDLFPIRGYNKRYLVISSIILGLLGSAMLLLLYHSGSISRAVSKGHASVQHLADLIVVCFFAMHLEGAAVDTLGEGKCSELMRLNPESGSSVITFKFGWALVGTVITQAYVGILSDERDFRALFWISFGLLLMPLVPTLLGWIPEQKRSAEGIGMRSCCGCMFDEGMFQKKKVPFVIIALSALAAPVMSAVSTFTDLGIGLVCSGFILILLVMITYAVFPARFFSSTMGMMLLVLCRIKMTSGLNYFYTASGKCLPDGPQFSYTFYITSMGIAGAIITLIAVLLYQAFMSSWKYRPVLLFSTAIGSVASIVDLIIIMRWNIAIGVPDKLLFLVGNATFENLTTMLHSIPMHAISAKLAPPGMESAVFAYSIGIQTFCSMVTNLLGSGIIEWTGISGIGDCNFDKLPILIVIFHVLLPFVVTIPAVLFIPNVHQTDQLIDWEKERWYEDEPHDQDQMSSKASSVEMFRG